MLLLDNPVRSYAWGSTTVIAELLGRAPDGTPQAELWVGAHPDDPSRVAGASDTLLDRIVADPSGTLGPAVVDAYGARLPFLLKVLAVERPLSLQVHPSLSQARAGFAAEQAAGIPPDAPDRNYRDANHKPELICALTGFDALCGVRPLAATRRLLEALALPQLSAELADLDEDVLVRSWLSLDDARAADLVAGLGAAAARLDADDEFAVEAGTLARLATSYPGDRGVLVAALLNRVHLEPGEALYLPAGRPHAYLHGTGVELLASSDNVLRGGLTDKHVDVAELLRVLDTTPAPVKILRPVPSAAGASYEVALPDFALSMLSLDRSSYDLPTGSPQLLLALEGRAVVRLADAEVELPQGVAAFLRSDDPGANVSGTGLVARATVGSALAGTGQDQAG